MLEIPLFALDLCPLPGEAIPLHIFEERYQALLAHCLSDDSSNLFAICLPTEIERGAIGSLVRVEEVVEEFPDGRSFVICAAIGRYELIERLPDNTKPFPVVRVKSISDESCRVDPGAMECCQNLFKELAAMREIAVDISISELPEAAFVIAILAGIELEERRLLLSLSSEKDRIEALTNILKFELALERSQNTIQSTFEQ